MEAIRTNTGPSASAAGEAREVEWQFDAVDLRPVERWIKGRAGHDTDFVLTSKGTRLHLDLYADTEDWRLHRAGLALRVRRRRGASQATLKSMTPPTAGLRDRLEVSQSGRSDGLATMSQGDGPVSDRVRSVAGHRVLRPLVEVRTRRTTFEVSTNGSPVAEIALDRTTIPVGDGEEPARLRRVEIEVLDAATGPDLSSFVEAMAFGTELKPASLSKFEVGLLARGLEPWRPPDLGPTSVSDRSSVGELAFAVMRTHFAVFLAREPGARLGDDIEQVHDMRVAIRRIRAAMSLFADALPVRTARLRDELAWCAAALGAVRDLDVQIERLDSWAADGTEEPGTFEVLRARLAGQRIEARAALLRLFESRRFERLVSGLTSMLVRGPLRRSPASRASILAVGPDLIRSRLAKTRRAAAKVKDGGDPTQFHRLRIRCKRLRYAAEFLEPVYGRPAQRMIRRLAKLQALLGLRQDAHVAAANLREMALHTDLTPAAIFAMGRIAERYARQVAELDATFPRAYSRIRGAAWQKLSRAMTRRRREQTRPPASRAASGSEAAEEGEF